MSNASNEVSIKEYSETEAALETLKARITPMVYDVTTTKGMDVAKKDRAEIRGYRTALEAKRKEIKAPVIALGKLIDDEAKRITNELLALETPIDELIKAEEKRKAEEKAERERIEAERVSRIKGRISSIRATPGACIGKTAQFMREAMAGLEDIEPTIEEFAEFTGEAMVELSAAKALLSGMIYDADEAEKQRAELEALREENARLERERAAREQEERERARLEQEKRNAEERASREAEENALRDEAEKLKTHPVNDSHGVVQIVSAIKSESESDVDQLKLEQNTKLMRTMVMGFAQLFGNARALKLLSDLSEEIASVSSAA